jgi:hypothetical protein
MRLSIRNLALFLALCFLTISHAEATPVGEAVALSFSDTPSSSGCVTLHVKNISSKAISAYSITVL